MRPETITTAVAVIIGFSWSLHRDVADLHREKSDLRERMARIEDQVQMLASQMQTVMQTAMDRDRERERTTSPACRSANRPDLLCAFPNRSIYSCPPKGTSRAKRIRRRGSPCQACPTNRSARRSSRPSASSSSPSSHGFIVTLGNNSLI